MESLQARALAQAERARAQGLLGRSGDPRLDPSTGEVEYWRSQRLLKIGGVPEIYLTARWSEIRSPVVQNWAKSIVDRTSPTGSPGLRGHGLIIFGPVGTGKSSAAALCCHRAATFGKTVRWSYVPTLTDTLAKDVKSRVEEVKHQETVDLLVWDDFGVRDLADWEIGFLDQIVDVRQRRRKPMIVTTNLNRVEMDHDARLARMLDRWRQRTASVGAVLDGASARKRETTE